MPTHSSPACPLTECNFSSTAYRTRAGHSCAGSQAWFRAHWNCRARYRTDGSPIWSNTTTSCHPESREVCGSKDLNHHACTVPTWRCLGAIHEACVNSSSRAWTAAARQSACECNQFFLPGRRDLLCSAALNQACQTVLPFATAVCCKPILSASDSIGAASRIQ